MAALPVIRQIMDVATHPNVAVCWNSNAEDLQGEGLETISGSLRIGWGYGPRAGT